MKLVVDHFKQSGKWYETYSIPFTNEEIKTIQPSCDHDAWLDFFEEKAGYPLRSKEFTAFIRIEDDDPENQVFCRHLVHPNHPKLEYVPLRSF
jgi:hypothetical protein